MPPTTLIQDSISNMRLLQLVRHLDLLAAIVCASLVVLGCFTGSFLEKSFPQKYFHLNLGWINLSLVILPAAYVIGGYESAREG